MKQIVIISSVFPPEQVTSALLNYDIAKELSKKHEVTVLRPYPTRPIGAHYSTTELVAEPFETILVDSFTCPEYRLIGRMKESISFSKKCVEYIETHHEKIDFIFNGGWQLFGVYLIARAAVRYRIPYLITVQDIYPESLLTGHHYPKAIQWMIKMLLLPMDKYYTSHAVKVRTISDEMADYMSRTRHLPRSHYVTVNNWQNDEDFENLAVKPFNKEKFVFAYVGSINVHANVELMIKAFHDADQPNAEFWIYGGGNRRELCEKLVKDLGSNRIFFGQVSREEVPSVQARADVMVIALPKGNGGLCLPSKMTSYMLSGKPILASIDKGSTTERYIREADCGIVVDPDNVELLKDGFARFGSMDRSRLLEMSANSRSFAERNLTRRVNLPVVTSIIEQAIN